VRTGQDDDADVCYRCGYALTGIADERPCPECGLLARRSRRRSDELHYTRPRWMRRLSIGTNLLLLAVLLLLAAPFLAVVLSKLANAKVPLRGFAWLLALAPLLPLDLVALLVLAGAWLLSSPEGYPPADRADRRRRWLLRVLAVAPLVGVFAKNVERHLIFSNRFWGIYDHGWNPMMIAMAASSIALIPLPLLTFLTLRSLARRARSAHLAEHCLIVGVGASSAIAYVVVLGLVSFVARERGQDMQWLERSNVGIGLILAFAVAGLLFAIWGAYLLVRFALAFRRTARQLRSDWRNDDRALAGVAPQLSP
jgi:hypothetical protein